MLCVFDHDQFVDVCNGVEPDRTVNKCTGAVSLENCKNPENLFFTCPKMQEKSENPSVF